MTLEELINNTEIRLKKENNPVKPLAYLYIQLFGYDRKIYSILGGLLKRYTPEILLEAILDLYHENGFRKRLQFYAENRYQQKNRANSEPVPLNNLNDYLKGMLANG